MPHRIIYIFLAALISGVGIAGWRYMATRQPSEQAAVSDMTPPATGEPQKSMTTVTRATLKTNYGDIALELFSKDAPMTVDNFLQLSREGFYNGTRFHRVIKGFMIQGGDPKSKDDDWSDDGTGGPGYTFQDEINAYKIIRGAIAMANAGPATNGSQFFIVTADAAPWLDGKHTVFGRVVSGMDAVEKIENAAVDKSAGDHPIDNVMITAVEIAEQ